VLALNRPLSGGEEGEVEGITAAPPAATPAPTASEHGIIIILKKKKSK
jgi:hypothetical protein